MKKNFFTKRKIVTFYSKWRNTKFSTYPPKKYYDNHNTWNLIKTTIIVIFSITSDQVLLITATWLAVSESIQNTGHVASILAGNETIDLAI